MDGKNENLPPRLQEIVADFSWAEDREKLELLLEYAEQLPLLPDWLAQSRAQMQQVHECMTPVFVYARADEAGRLEYFFDVPPESPTVRGYAAIMRAGLSGATPTEVLSVPNDFYLAMGLEKVLTHQRLNGMVGILAHMKRLALQAQERDGGM
jgi:cysteine desulfuration protein SufE